LVDLDRKILLTTFEEYYKVDYWEVYYEKYKQIHAFVVFKKNP